MALKWWSTNSKVGCWTLKGSQALSNEKVCSNDCYWVIFIIILSFSDYIYQKVEKKELYFTINWTNVIPIWVMDGHPNRIDCPNTNQFRTTGVEWPVCSWTHPHTSPGRQRQTVYRSEFYWTSSEAVVFGWNCSQYSGNTLRRTLFSDGVGAAVSRAL